jgi:hypothetical protein
MEMAPVTMATQRPRGCGAVISGNSMGWKGSCKHVSHGLELLGTGMRVAQHGLEVMAALVERA